MKIGYEKYKETKKVMEAMKKSYDTAKNDTDKLRAQQLFILFLKDYAKMTNYDLDHYSDELDKVEVSDSVKADILDEIYEYKQNKPKIKVDIPQVFNSKKETIDEKLTEVELEIRNYEAQKLVEKINEDFNNPNHLSISTWVFNFAAFVELYKNTIDFEKIIDYINNIFNKFDKNNEYDSELKQLLEMIENIKANVIHVDNQKEIDLLIESIHNAKEEALNKSTYKITTDLLDEYEVTVEEEKLVDKNSNPVTKQKMDKKINDKIKAKLLNNKQNTDDELIDSTYKKIGYASMLVNSKDTKKEQVDTYEEAVENAEYSEELMKKGLGKC